jgi:hypothetical protein
MTLLEQTYTINSRRVVINNYSAAEEPSRPRGEFAPQPSVLGGDVLDGPGQREQTVGEISDARVGCGVERCTSSIDRGLDLPAGVVIDHETDSFRSAGAGVGAPASAVPTVRDRAGAWADSPSGAPTRTATAGAPPAPVVAPFYQDEFVTLYCGDALKLTELWTHADVLITDPPYGLQALAGAYGTSKRTIANDMDTFTRDAVLELWGDRPVAVFASPRMPEPPGAWSDRLVWDKGQLGLNGGPWRYAHENIFVRGRGWTRVDNRSTSVMRHTSQANRKHVVDHIHSKPLPLLQQLVAAAPPGVIVDPFAGGGPTVAAAKLLGRQIIAIELEESNCELIVERLRQQSFPISTAPRHEQPQLPEA